MNTFAGQIAILALWAMLLLACGDETGSVGGPCYGNLSCNAGLVCEGGICTVGSGDATGGDLPGGDTSGEGIIGCVGATDGTTCDDGDPCTLSDVCVGGACLGGALDPCTSENSCEKGTCEAFVGCVYEGLEDGAACSVPCFNESQCVGGFCVPDPEALIVCPPPENEDGCVSELQCNPSTGLCTGAVYEPPGTECDTDSNLCAFEVCDAFGGCVSTGAVNDCAANMAEDPCSFYTCNTKTGVCSASGFLGEISCDDANTCTFNDTCELDDFNYASCKGTPFPTDDGNSCTDDACLDGVVTHTKVDGLPCVPDDLCSPTGLCEEGLCVAATPCECSKDADCPQSEDACVGNKLCNAETGTCEIDPSSVIQCEPSPLPCHTNECLPGFGSCIELTSPNGTPCSDGNACTAFDACDGGACVGSEVLDCDDGMFCNGQETCDSNDGCQAGVAPIIDDGVACTVDSCDDLADVVIHQPDQLQCDDGVFCNGAELCDLTLGCKGPDAPFVDDGFECTTDFCDEATKTVGHIPDQAVCDTNNPCKVDACILGVGCESTPIADCCGNELFDAGEECDDGNDVSFDGCSSTCVDECMYTSAGTVSDEHKLSATQGNFYGSLGDGDLFGWAVANPADMDGDGVQDLVIGMRLDDDGGASTGAIWIAYLNHDGTTKGQQKISDLKGGFNGDLDPGDNFGSAVASIGDLNGDGIVDLAVGAMDDDDGGPARGAVWILFMKADGTVKGHQKISMEHGLFEGQLEDGDAFGRAISVVGDLDGDGYVELAVGSPGCDDGGKDAGAVWILFLTAGGKVKHEQRISDAQGGFTGGIAKQDLFGSAVAAIGDSDGDGVFDLAVGAPFDNDGGWDVGSVWILYLNADGTVKNHQKIGLNLGGFTGDIADDGYFGDALTSLGDLDANGFPDLAVGASGEDDGGTDKGAVWILYMGPGGTVIAEEKIGVVSGGLTANLDDGDFFGGSLAALGKTDGTMRPRLLVGAWGDDDGGLDKGAVYILDLIYQCSVCGNGELEAWEICDDGNIQNGDGCPSDCVP